MTSTNKNLNVKMLLKSIFAIVMVAALLLGCVACKPADEGNDVNTGNTGNTGNNNNNETDKYEGLSDVEYAQAITLDVLGGTLDTFASVAGAYSDLAGISLDNIGATAELNVMLGDLAIDMLEQAIFGTDDSGMDMSFLSNVGLNMELDSTADMAQLQLALGLSNTEIVKLFLLTDKETIWAGAPALTDSFLEVGLADMVVVPNDAIPSAMKGILSIIPSEEKLAEILNRYAALAVKEIDTVERTTETLELDGLKQDATKLTIKIYEQDALDAVKAILNAAKTDADIKKIVEDYGAFYNDMMAQNYGAYDMQWENIDAYAEFTKAIDEALTQLPAEAEDTENPIGLTLYVDKNHNFIGWDMTFPGQDNVICSTRMITEGNNFKYLCEMGDVGGEMKITGSGTTNNGVITGTFTITSDGTAYVNMDLKDFDMTDKDAISGTITLKPTDDAIDDLFGGPIPIPGMSTVAMEIKMDVTKDKEDIEIKLLGDGALFVGLGMKSATKTPAALQKPTNTVPLTDQASVMGLLAGMDFTSVFTNLRTAGVPEMLVTALEGLIPAM